MQQPMFAAARVRLLLLSPDTKYITFHETKCEAFQIIHSNRYQRSLIQGIINLSLTLSSPWNKYNLLLP
jgi:hypothetical protein